jgi:hypothetical protein
MRTDVGAFYRSLNVPCADLHEDQDSTDLEKCLQAVLDQLPEPLGPHDVITIVGMLLRPDAEVRTTAPGACLIELAAQDRWWLLQQAPSAELVDAINDNVVQSDTSASDTRS